jgi:DNA polymerase-3 subunit delta'
VSEALPPWLGEIALALDQRLRSGGLPHALLIAGPRGLGKRRLVDWLVARVLCMAPGPDGTACGRCRECILRLAGTHPDLWRTEPQERADGGRRQEILIDQIRELIPHLAAAGQRGGHCLAIVDPADRLTPSAANAFLKTLEEPAPRRLLILVADEVERVPATVRSRCTRIEVRTPSPAHALSWLEEQGLDGESARKALELADGQPLRALELAGGDALALSAAVASELSELARGTLSAAALARDWVADRPELRMRLAERFAWRWLRPRALTDPALFSKLEAWLAEAERVRQELSTPLRAEFLIAGVLARWPGPSILDR